MASKPWASALTFAVSMTLVACGPIAKKGGDAPESPPTVDGPRAFGSVMGMVKDTEGAMRGDVTVTASNGMSTKTNAQGFFALQNVPVSDRLVLKIHGPGLVSSARVTRVRLGESSFVEAVTPPETQGLSLTSSSGGQVTAPSGATLDVKPGTLVDPAGNLYSGPVEVALTTIDPTTPAGRAAFPGDFRGTSAKGAVVPIMSFGLVDVTLRGDAGQLLNLASGKTAGLAIPIAGTLKAEAPAEIPLWSFDFETGIWLEEGKMIRDGDVYRGEVPHFSPWNCDLPMPYSWVRGTLKDCGLGNAPVKGATFTCSGQRLAWNAGETSTREDGQFAFEVNAAEDMECFASKNGVASIKMNLKSAELGATLELDDVCFSPPKMKIALTWGDKPADLDSHLTLPSEKEGERLHVYYANPAPDKTVLLDTDATQGRGPEITTAYTLRDGVYRYSVFHFGGEGSIKDSGATINMIVDGLGVFSLAPPQEATTLNDLWRLWDIEVSGGRVQNVKTINDVVTSPGSLSESAFSP